MERELEWLILYDLLELPIKQDSRESTRDALREQVAADAVIADLWRARYWRYWVSLWARPAYGRSSKSYWKLYELLMVYTHSRAAAAELSASWLSRTAGAVTCGRITPDSVAVGQVGCRRRRKPCRRRQFRAGSEFGGAFATWPFQPPHRLA